MSELSLAGTQVAWTDLMVEGLYAVKIKEHPSCENKTKALFAESHPLRHDEGACCREGPCM